MNFIRRHLIAVFAALMVTSFLTGGLVQRAVADDPVIEADCTGGPVTVTGTDQTFSIDCVVPLPVEPEPPSIEFPDASNTGPTGTLTEYTGDMVITTNDTVIDSKIITGDLVIRATNVTVSNSEVTGTVSTDVSQVGSFTVVDSIVDAGNQVGTPIGEARFTITRSEIRGGNKSINCWLTCVVEDSYIHGQYEDLEGEAHESAIRIGAHNTITGNSIVCDAPFVAPNAGCSADITGYGDFAAVEDVLIEGNLIRATVSGGFCVYGGSSESKPYPNAIDVRFIDNVFERGPLDTCGEYGPVSSFDVEGDGNVWTGNVWDDDGTPVAPSM